MNLGEGFPKDRRLNDVMNLLLAFRHCDENPFRAPVHPAASSGAVGQVRFSPERGCTGSGGRIRVGRRQVALVLVWRGSGHAPVGTVETSGGV